MHAIQLYGIQNIPLIKKGDDVGSMIVQRCEAMALTIENGDILVIAQKIVSKAEGAVIDLNTITPSDYAVRLSELTGRDARLCQVYLNEAREVVEVKGRMVITVHRLGFRCSSSGVDKSNVAPSAQSMVVLLPNDPDASAAQIRKTVLGCTGKNVAVIINDSFGRADRDGSIGIAIGLAGIAHLEMRSQNDLYGNTSNSRIAMVDELAAAASVLMGQADEKTPAVLIRGVTYTQDENASIRNILIEEKAQ